MRTDISIIVTARNYGRYLKECLDSCLNQTVKPFEVIYSDDFSTDNSIEVASGIKGVTVIKHDKHNGVVIARNDGVAHSSGNILVHVDGDDITPPNFLEKHLEVFDETTPFVYAAAHAFGDSDIFWRVCPWGVLNLWNRNFVNTSCMISREAFMKVGGWKETEYKTMWDWDLALRLSKVGIPKKSPAVLEYRQHGDSWGSNKDRSGDSWGGYQKCLSSIKKHNVDISIGLVYGGRIPKLLDKWMENLIDDVKILVNKPEFVIYNNSDVDLKTKLKKYEKHFSKIKVLTFDRKIEFTDEIDRRNKVSELLADAYNVLLEHMSGDIIHFREDDVMTPEGGFEKLFNFLIDQNEVALNVNPAVAGLYFNRNPNWKKFVGGYYDADKRDSREFETLPSWTEPIKVDFTGTGCLLYWRDLCPRVFKPYLDGIQAHDWAWGLDLKKSGGVLHVLPDVICRHYNTVDDYLQPLDRYDITPFNNYTKNAVEEPKPSVITKVAFNSVVA